MKYMVCQQPGQFEMGEAQIPERKDDEALLAVRRIGICGTDLHAFAGNQAFFSYPRILGHELAAEVLEVGKNVQGISKGDRVVIMPYVHCGECVACRKGKTNCCTDIRVLGVHTDGGMQEQITVRTDLLIRANELSYQQMAIVEPLAIGAHAIRRAALRQGEFIVVVGCGPIGVGIIKLAQLAGAKVIAIDTDKARLDFVREKIGVDHVVEANSEAVGRVATITDGDMATAVFDATGNKRALEIGVNYMAHGGRYILVGLSKGELCFTHPAIHAKESTIMCSRNATLEDFHAVINNVANFPTAAYVTKEIVFDDIISHFDHALQTQDTGIKTLIRL